MRRKYMPYRRAVWNRLAGGVAGCVRALTFLPPVVDASIGVIKPHSGCRVVGVIDGDTLRNLCDGSYESLRLRAIDTPEVNAKCGAEWHGAVAATWAIRWYLWSGWQIDVTKAGRDWYNRLLVFVRVDGDSRSERMINQCWTRGYGTGRRSWCGASQTGLPGERRTI